MTIESVILIVERLGLPTVLVLGLFFLAYTFLRGPATAFLGEATKAFVAYLQTATEELRRIPARVDADGSATRDIVRREAEEVRKAIEQKHDETRRSLAEIEEALRVRPSAPDA